MADNKSFPTKTEFAGIARFSNDESTSKTVGKRLSIGYFRDCICFEISELEDGKFNKKVVSLYFKNIDGEIVKACNAILRKQELMDKGEAVEFEPAIIFNKYSLDKSTAQVEFNAYTGKDDKKPKVYIKLSKFEEGNDKPVVSEKFWLTDKTGNYYIKKESIKLEDRERYDFIDRLKRIFEACNDRTHPLKNAHFEKYMKWRRENESDDDGYSSNRIPKEEDNSDDDFPFGD